MPIAAAPDRVNLQLHRAALAGGCATQGRRARRSRRASSLGEEMECIPVAADDVLGFLHLLLEAGVVGSKLLASVRRFNQEQCFAVRDGLRGDGRTAGGRTESYRLPNDPIG